METKLQNLFGIDEGKGVRQKLYENLYVNHGVDFEPVFYEAHQMTLNDPTPDIYRGRGFMANHMNWHLLGLLKQRYRDKMKADKYERPYYSIDENTRVYFKKLNEKYAPENVTTDHVRELNSMSLFYGQDQLTVLYAGFKIPENRRWAEISGCFLVEMKTLKEPNWVSDLSELGYEISKAGIIAPITTIELPEEIILTPKNKNSDLGKTSDGNK
jgi:hypothetical protein